MGYLTDNAADILAGNYQGPGYGGVDETLPDHTAPADGSSAAAVVFEGAAEEVTIKCPTASPEAVRYTTDGTAPSATSGTPLVAGIGVVERKCRGPFRVWSSGGTGIVSVRRRALL